MPRSVVCQTCGRIVLLPEQENEREAVCPGCRSTVSSESLAASPTVDQTIVRKSSEPPIVSGSPPPSSGAELSIGSLIDGRYELSRELGRGTYGVVFVAHDRKQNRTVAIKLLYRKHVLENPDAVRRFEAEAAILCGVTHPHVLPVFDQGVFDGQNFIVFAYVKGRTVKDLVVPGGFPDPVKACRLVIKLANVLHFVHAEHHILHRDVKPANMMLVDGDDDALYLMDFGLAVCDQADVTRATQDGTVMGTPLYMSPEQVAAKISDIGHRSDLYSAAVILFELATGRVPFKAKWPYPLVMEICSTPAPSPREFRPDLDSDLCEIILKGLEKDPDKRYQTGKEFAGALEAWVAGSRVSSSGTSSKVLAEGGRSAQAPPPRGRAGVLDLPLDVPLELPEDRPESGRVSVNTGGSSTLRQPEGSKAAVKPAAPKPAPPKSAAPKPAPPKPAPPKPAPPKPGIQGKASSPSQSGLPAGTSPRVAPAPVHQPPREAPRAPQPVAPPAATAKRLADDAAESADRPKSRKGMLGIVLIVAAVGLLFGGVAALIYAIQSGDKPAQKTPGAWKSDNNLRDAVK